MTRSGFVTLALVSMLLSACHGRDRSAPEHLAKARELFDRHDDAAALAEVEKASKADPRNRDAYMLAGEINEDLGDFLPAYTAFLRADMVEPDDRRARVRSIRILIAAGELDAAAGRISSTLGDDPNNIEVLALRALVEQRQGDAVKARRDARQVLAKAPDHAVASVVMASLALGEKNTGAAMEAIDRGLAAGPDDAQLLELKTLVLLVQNAREQAIATARTLVAVRPRAPKPRLDLAELQAAAGAVDAGEQTLREGLAAAPASQPMRMALADFLSRHRDSAAVEAVLRAGIEAAPDDSAYDCRLAADLAVRGRADEATAVVKAAVARLKDGVPRTAAKITLARLQIGNGESGGARAVLDDVVKATPDNDAALMLRADIMRPDEVQRQIADLLSVTARQPGNPAVFERLSAAYLRAGRPDEALAAARRIVDLRPKDLQASGRFVALAEKLKRPEEGQREIAAFVTRNPASAQGRVVAVRAALGRKDWAAAETALDSLRDLPDTREAALALEGEITEGQGRPAEAAQLYKPLLRRSGDGRFDPAAASAYSRASIAAGQSADALAAFDAMAGSASGSEAAAVHLAAAALHLAVGHDAEAQAAAAAAMRAAPREPWVYAQQASALAKANAPDAAIAVLEAGLTAGAPQVPLLLAKALIETGAGRSEAAIASYRAVLDADPTSLAAANNLASLLADRKPLDRAQLTAARDALRRFMGSGNPSILDTLAWAGYRLGDTAEAKALLARIGADQSSQPEWRFHYGAVLLASGDKAAGRALLETVMGTDFPGRAEAEALARS